VTRTLERAQPLLGTLVVMRLTGEDDGPARLEAAADAAFAAVADVHRLMSFFEAGSDVRRLARARPGERVRVAPATAAVLVRAQAWARASGGAFDAGCGARAVAAGWLPAPDDAAPPGEMPFEDALVVEGHEVLVRSTCWLDVGGIAKGRAVDLAVAVLRRHGVAGGVVNAGGDLRVFGTAEETVRVRSPHDPSILRPVALLRDGACATSARGEVSARPGRGAPAGIAPDAEAGAGAGSGAAAVRSITVFAPTACAADALTKIVWLQGDAARPLLRRARAHALRIDATGTMTRL
jgi:thiamine biosynthesis lipoprotein